MTGKTPARRSQNGRQVRARSAAGVAHGRAGTGRGAANGGGAPACPWQPVTPREIALAVPQCGRRARSQGEFLRALARDQELAQLRADRQRNIRACARVLARYASWADRTTRPTRQRICKLARVVVSTWKAVRRWLEDHAYLGTVREGWTDLGRRPIVLEHPNEAAIYVLCVPRDKPKHPVVVPGQERIHPLSRSRSERGIAPARELPRTPLSDDGSPAYVVAYLRSQVAELGRGPGKSLTDRALLAIARPFLAARWSPADLAYAIGHDPVRAHRAPLRTVAHPSSWLAWRLSRWTADPVIAWAGWQRYGRWDHDAWPVPGPSPTARVVAEAAAARAASEQHLRRRPGADPAPFASRIREALGWKPRASSPPSGRPSRVRWIQYPTPTHHQERAGSRPREGTVWAEGPRPGTVWAIPVDEPHRTYVLVHYFPDAPEASYALDTDKWEQPPATDDHPDDGPVWQGDGRPPQAEPRPL